MLSNMLSCMLECCRSEAAAAAEGGGTAGRGAACSGSKENSRAAAAPTTPHVRAAAYRLRQPASAESAACIKPICSSGYSGCVQTGTEGAGGSGRVESGTEGAGGSSGSCIESGTEGAGGGGTVPVAQSDQRDLDSTPASGPNQPWAGPGVSPLWAFGSAEAAGGVAGTAAAAAAATAAAPVLLPLIGELVYSKLLANFTEADYQDVDHTRRLRCVNRAARAFVDARRLRLDPSWNMAALPAALLALPPRFPAVRKLDLHACHWTYTRGYDAAARAMDAVSRFMPHVLLRALPQLQELCVALEGGAPTAEAIVSAAGQLPHLTRLSFGAGIRHITTGDYKKYAAALQPGTFMHLQVFELNTRYPAAPVIAALAALVLPCLRHLAIGNCMALGPNAEYTGGASGMQLLARAPWFAGLQELHLHRCDVGAAGDLAGCSAGALKCLTLELPASDDAGAPALGCIAMPALTALHFGDYKCSWAPPTAPAPSGRGLAALLAAPGAAAGLVRIELRTEDNTQLAGTLAAAALPALRALSLEFRAAAAAAAVNSVVAAPWARQLTELRVGVQPVGLVSDEERDAAALRALAAAPLDALRELSVALHHAPQAGLLALCGAHWLGGLQALRLKVQSEEAAAQLRAAVPAFEALCRAGRVQLDPVRTPSHDLDASYRAEMLARMAQSERRRNMMCVLQ